MQLDKIGGYPYKMTKEGNFIVLRFFPKDPSAEYPKDVDLVLRLNEEDRQKLIKLLSQIK